MLNLKPNEKVVKALAKICNNDEIKTIRKWLEGKLNSLREEADNQSNYQAMLVALGHRQALKEVITIFEGKFFKD